jgi:hypothetical protein
VRVGGKCFYFSQCVFLFFPEQTTPTHRTPLKHLQKNNRRAVDAVDGAASTLGAVDTAAINLFRLRSQELSSFAFTNKTQARQSGRGRHPGDDTPRPDYNTRPV